MLKVILQDPHSITPFNERARDLRIQNKPVWLAQRDVLAPYTSRELEIPSGAPLPELNEEVIVYQDNLFFDQFYMDAFIAQAKTRPYPSRAAFHVQDDAFREHCLPLSHSFTRLDESTYLADLWYYPNGTREEAKPLIIDMQAREAGYYHVPTYMAHEQGDLIYYVPLRSLIAIDAWVHVFIMDIVFGLFGRGARFEDRLEHDLLFKLGILWKALYEGKQVLECSGVVQIGKGCTIDPTAVIHGPTTIGDNVTIAAGVVIENCTIGSNVNISQGCQLTLSVVGDGAFLPFRASLFMTTVMDNSMIAQNTCLQMSVVGRNAFIGAGCTFTDFNLLSAPLKARNARGELEYANRPVMGCCVGHNCRIGSGMIVYPARMIESDVVLFASKERRVISRDVSYEESDHHTLPNADQHRRLYPRPGEAVEDSW